MKQVKHYVASLGVLLMVTPAGFGQSLDRSNREPQFESERGGIVNHLTEKYRSTYVPPVDISNSSRMDQLIRAGNLYLSLNDAIALALENNIGLESQRYQFQIAEVAYKTSLVGPNGSWDPILNGTFNWGHSASIQTNSQTSGGVPLSVGNTKTKNLSIQQTYRTGGNATFSFNNRSATTNGLTAAFPNTYTSGIQLDLAQPLLNGGGFSYNKRTIYIAQNTQRLADVTFQTNINTTLNTVIQAYWNLVSAALNVDVVRQNLALAERQLSDNRKQVDIGTMAAIDVVQSETNVSSAELNVVTAEAAVLTQEVALKNALSRNGIASASLAAIHIIPVDRARVPEVEPVQPIQDLMEMAMRNRPELAQQRINMETAQINLKAARNQLLPQLNLQGSINNPGVGGVNPRLTQVLNADGSPKFDDNGNAVTKGPSPTLIGGYGNILQQLFWVPTLTYSAGFTLTIPLRNRSAQYTYVTQELQYRQSELALQQQLNQVRADVSNAQININTARGRYFLAVKQSAQQAQVLEAEQRKLALGSSNVFQVNSLQTQLLTARQTEVTAQAAYMNAKLAMDVATSNLMDKYNIVYDEAKNGSLNRRADPIPDVINQPVVR